MLHRSIKQTWKYSGSTISIVVKQVIKAILRKFYPYFKDCIGALDGCHLSAIVSPDDIRTFRNRKSFISQNVLGVVDFDMIFNYCLTGWKGSAHDGKVLDDALQKGIAILLNKYYLGDTGYALSKFCLTPYRGVRYHLKEWAGGNLRPQNKEELFNLRHTFLRNAIERTFGVTKRRFPTLCRITSYPILRQIGIVGCCFLLHNFIRYHNIYEDEGDEYEDDDDEVAVNTAIRAEEASNINELKSWHNEIASSMWDDYLFYLPRKPY